MNLGIVNTDIPLLLSASFVSEVDNVIDCNVDTNVALVSLFFSRLIKGLQNLSRSDMEIPFSWGLFSYEIEDIGVVRFTALMDEMTGEKAFHILFISWTFNTSRFFNRFIV